MGCPDVITAACEWRINSVNLKHFAESAKAAIYILLPSLVPRLSLFRAQCKRMTFKPVSEKRRESRPGTFSAFVTSE